MSRGEEYNHYQKTRIETTLEEKEMKNDERDENSPVETIDERLKRLRTNEIDGRMRLKLREEEGGGAGKTMAPGMEHQRIS